MTETYTVEINGRSYEWLYMGATVTGQGAWRSAGRSGAYHYDMVVAHQQGGTGIWHGFTRFRERDSSASWTLECDADSAFGAMDVAVKILDIWLSYREIWNREIWRTS